jgi:hypothetical protein
MQGQYLLIQSRSSFRTVCNPSVLLALDATHQSVVHQSLVLGSRGDICIVAPNICGRSEWNLLRITVLAPTILNRHLEFRSGSLWAGRAGERIPVVARFSATVQTDPGAHWLPVQWVPSFFPGNKAAGACRWPSTPSRAEVKETVELYTWSELVTVSLNTWQSLSKH